MRLTIADAADRSAAIVRLRAAERWAVDGATAEEMARGCALLDVLEDGRPVGAVAIELQGERATITGAASRGAGTWAELQMVEAALRRRGFRSLSMLTRRPGLVRALARRGYQPVRPADERGALELEKAL